MYKIIGADGQQYGPVSAAELRNWFAQGRIGPQTRVQPAGSTEWKSAAEFPELAGLFALAGTRQTGQGPPPILTAPKTKPPERGLAVLSFVLGVISFALCLSVLAGVPAIICGHIARRRAILSPTRYGGGAFANAGLVLGYVSIVFSIVIVGLLLPGLGRAKQTSQITACQNNLRQIGLAFKVWALDHGDQYPFNMSTNSGGTLQLCAVGPDGFDRNAVTHFLSISNELSTPNLLVCPGDTAKHPAADFARLDQGNVSYRLRTGANINGENPQEILALCPIHGNELFCDGNVRKDPRSRR